MPTGSRYSKDRSGIAAKRCSICSRRWPNPTPPRWPSPQPAKRLGGYGYCEDFPIEQYYRDVRIHTLHEGTTGIQALDLLGRKVVRGGGHAVMMLMGEFDSAIARAKEQPSLQPLADRFERATERVKSVLQHLSSLALGGQIDLFLADATLLLELVGIVAVGWQWLRQATVASEALSKQPTEADGSFYRRKLATAQFFMAYELPKTEGLAARLLDSDGLTLKPAEELFS